MRVLESEPRVAEWHWQLICPHYIFIPHLHEGYSINVVVLSGGLNELMSVIVEKVVRSQEGACGQEQMPRE